MPEPAELWRSHPLAAEIELVPTEWVYQYRGQDVSPPADLMDGTIVSLDELWENLIREGMHEPLIMRIGIRNRQFRLESGNHRIQLFHAHRVPLVPVTVEVCEECGPGAPDPLTDATHSFPFGEEVIVPTGAERYLPPSRVFRALAKG